MLTSWTDDKEFADISHKLTKVPFRPDFMKIRNIPKTIFFSKPNIIVQRKKFYEMNDFPFYRC